MGKFEDSFKRQVGRDTGKFVSNLIFGDKHSRLYVLAYAKKDET